MESIFGKPWDAVELEDVEAFLADAGDEGLTWEAKGTERPHPGSVRKHACAFANAIGGFLIIGASRKNERGPWEIDPVDFRGEEPRPWLSRVIRNGLRPVPRHDVQVWSLNGKHVAVVNVETVAEPPCMTSNGEVFVRVSGESHPVDDPATLRRLHEQGETRAAGAQAEARRATDPDFPYPFDPPYMQLRLALAPTGRADDIAGRLFTKSFEEQLYAAIERLPPVPLFPYPAYRDFMIEASQDALVVREPTEENRQRWTIRAAWDGSVAVFLDVLPRRQDGHDWRRLRSSRVASDLPRKQRSRSSKRSAATVADT
jgi:hypothetical protein